MILNLADADTSDPVIVLRALRSVHTPTVRSGARRDAYRTGLAQAEELWHAADTVTPLVSPLLRYYAVLQACQALVAASPARNSEWRLESGHGVKLEIREPQSGALLSLDDVVLKESGDNKSAQVIARTLNSPLLGKPTSVQSLVASLPSQHPLSAHGQVPRRSLDVHLQPMLATIALSPVPTSVVGERASKITRSDIDLAVVREWFADYPALTGLPDPVRMYSNPGLNLGEDPSLILEFDSQGMPKYSEWVRFFDVGAWPHYAASGPTVALPLLPGNSSVQHPLVTWLLILYAFSMLARYHSRYWVRLLDVDTTQSAVPLARLIDKSSANAILLLERTIADFKQASTT